MTDRALTPTPEAMDLALLKAVGLDRLAPEQRELAIHIAKKYDLDLMLKHLVMIEGRPYITRDGLLHVAHRSGKLDGIETTEPEIKEGFWRSTCSVYRKDMSHAFTYSGRYPTTGGNARFAPEMAVKVGEVMALRRAFDVAAPTAEERWDVDEIEVVPVVKESLRDKAAARAAEVRPLAPVIKAREAEGNPNEPSSAERAAEEAGMATQDYLALDAPLPTGGPPAAPVPPETPPPPTDPAPSESGPERAGLTVDQFRDVMRHRGIMRGGIATLLGCTPGELDGMIAAMTDEQRAALADDLEVKMK